MHVLTASIVVAQSVARASAAPLIYAYEYVVDDEDAKGEYYNWFGESRRLLGLPRVLFALGSATAVAFTLLAPPMRRQVSLHSHVIIRTSQYDSHQGYKVREHGAGGAQHALASWTPCSTRRS